MEKLPVDHTVINPTGVRPRTYHVVKIGPYEFATNADQTIFREICEACDGTGIRPGYGFSDGSRCWPCNYSGLRGRERDREGVEKLVARRHADAQRAADQRDREREENAKRGAEWQAANASLFEWLTTVDTDPIYSSFLIDMIVNARSMGSLCWFTEAQTAKLTEAMDKLLAAEVEKAAKAEATSFVGTVGQRQDFTLTVTKVITLDNHYTGGTKPLFIFRDQDGNEILWFASNWSADLDEGKTYKVTATVKEHKVSDRDFNRGTRQTIVTRLKVQGETS